MTLVEEVEELVRFRNNGPSCGDIAARILRLVAERQREPSDETITASMSAGDWLTDNMKKRLRRKIWSAMHDAFWRGEGIEL